MIKSVGPRQWERNEMSTTRRDLTPFPYLNVYLISFEHFGPQGVYTLICAVLAAIVAEERARNP